MQKDFINFKNDMSFKNAQKVMKHKDKISAQCIYFAELAAAHTIVESGEVR